MNGFQLQQIVTDIEDGWRVSHFCTTRLGISRKMLVSIKNHGDITRNGQHVNVHDVLHAGDRVHVFFPEETPAPDMVATEGELDILFEDDWLLVVNKPPGMASIPSRLHPERSLSNYVLGYYRKQGIPYAIHIVNRLDRDTSGLVLFAKHGLAHHRMSLMQRSNELERHYLAYAPGNVPVQTIDQPIGQTDHSFMERMVRPDGQRAITHILNSRLVRAFDQEISLLDIRLETGRTHQIRVHLSFLGHPLIGDTMYQGNPLLPRQALHSASATFLHPATGERVRFEAPLPEDLRLEG
ncbi:MULTISPECIES: RluA family pseudouridine synthase [unclassified Exiguobacterium]|uniref:RluA family pseudouridine synthase n=1 Tax=unclassified Exiguobacterium TaxID=2644629 RepID=UPI001BEAEADD|nr:MULTISPECIES: RluA family pseudouridine synthase [unclassified Exiguobacterium]